MNVNWSNKIENAPQYVKDIAEGWQFHLGRSATYMFHGNDNKLFALARWPPTQNGKIFWIELPDYCHLEKVN